MQCTFPEMRSRAPNLHIFLSIQAPLYQGPLDFPLFHYPVTMVLFVPWSPFPEVVPRSVFVWFLTIAFRLLQHSGLCVDSVWVSCFRCLVAVGVLALPGGGGGVIR